MNTEDVVEVNIEDIVVDYKYFPRVALNEETIARYKELYELGVKLPPLIVQKEKLILIDGFHRIEALKRLGWNEVEIELIDIPEGEIYLTSIELNRKHGLPFSQKDRNEQIRRLRFERDQPLTYEEIGKRVGLSTSRVGEICREHELKINGAINAKVDRRRRISPEETEEIQDRLEKGEPPSEVAKDYPVSESRVSQLRKVSSRFKPISKMPESWVLRSLRKRVAALNPLIDPDEIDFEVCTHKDHETYFDLVKEYAVQIPEINWFYPKERPIAYRYYELETPPPEINEDTVTIKLKLYWVNNGKYAQVKGTIPKRVLEYVRDKLQDSFEVEWPLTEEFILDEDQRPPDRRVFPELSDDELSDMVKKSEEKFEDEDLEDEEMRKWKDLLPE